MVTDMVTILQEIILMHSQAIHLNGTILILTNESYPTLWFVPETDESVGDKRKRDHRHSGLGQLQGPASEEAAQQPRRRRRRSSGLE